MRFLLEYTRTLRPGPRSIYEPGEYLLTRTFDMDATSKHDPSVLSMARWLAGPHAENLSVSYGGDHDMGDETSLRRIGDCA